MLHCPMMGLARHSTSHLLAPERHMGSHGGDPLQCIIGLLVFAVFGLVVDRSSAGAFSFLDEQILS